MMSSRRDGHWACKAGGRRHGFTLVELLVVIGIIAVLGAILFPVFAAVRGKARVTRDVSNLRQIMMAIEMYHDDFYERYPPGDPAGLDALDALSGQLAPYVRNPHLYIDSQENTVIYFSARTYHMGVAIDNDDEFLNPGTYQCFFKGKDGLYDLAAKEIVNADNLWVDAEKRRVVSFSKVQQSLK